MDARTSLLLQVALNGSRSASEHPHVPRTPDELAEAARASVAEGARVLHLHPYDSAGIQTLRAPPCEAALRAVRALCPGVPVSLSTSAEIEPDPRTRRELVASWTALPELVTANQGEPGIRELCDELIERGVGIEAGLLSVADAEAFVRSGLGGRCVRVLVEPLDADPAQAVAQAARMEAVLVAAGIALEQVHHGDGIASWAVNERAVRRGHGIRTGLEDTTVLPDGRPAADNAALVRAAAAMLA
ncbi:MAG: 3-keto-5-aminohexanoate cleavage protein [Solirubrobacteraceae bacterium]